MKSFKVFFAFILFCLPLAIMPFNASAGLVADTANTLAANADAGIMLFGVEIGGVVASIAFTVLSLIGVASALVKLLTPLVAYTTTKVDDKWLGFFNKYLALLVGFTDKYLALNPSKSNARNG